MDQQEKIVRHCAHCNNATPHDIVYHTASSRLWDQIDNFEDGLTDIVYDFLG